MRFHNLLLLIITLNLGGCGKVADVVGTNPPPTNHAPNGESLPVISGDNVMSLTVNGANCSAGSYSNKPCVAIKICAVDNAHCQVINDILLDTGSFGLRLFSSVVTVPLLPVTNGPNTLAECVQFGGGSTEWGTINMASVTLGNESPVQIPIQVINSSFGTRPTQCQNSDLNPIDAGFNGILGVGFYPYDCGGLNNGCTTDPNNKMYYSCAGGTCVGTTVSNSHQVQNPIPFLAQDNNGLLISLPSVSAGGAAYADGYLILGIGTRSNNQPQGVSTFTANSNTGDFSAIFNGVAIASFLDTGSNAIYFDDAITDCSRYSAQESIFYCPESQINLRATTVGVNSVQEIIPFEVQNVNTLLSGGGSVFNNISGKGGGTFDWGLPFYLGRNVYQGFYGKSSSLGSDNFWAY